ncbi:hypothetical protein PHLGIDRAFT_183756 [Phlebiopsis gigantea 11061_1 CR5-6]|uniref:Uncharacterized protein n=1 Tax=Phlebiopsis gigantea (strain 11061_1 CR5-6) TaxID=745531 RepID=A0A0C3NZI3_PHLG1|nr:hypothetical protein PHLGIDRAFT_183756 [Phlebiopsis gigantea 11061_1 CR5-6]
MNVHVFTNTSVLDLNTLRTRASLLVGDATFVDGWRAVPLPPTDSLPDHPPDTTALDDFVHYIHDLDNSSFQSLPSPGQPRTRSDPSHSPATFLSQTRPASYGQQRVGQQTLFDESVSRTRQSDAPGSSSIYAMSGQLSIHTADISARNVLSPSSRISSNAVQSIPVPPNQLELYPHQPSLHSMQSANQDSLYGSHELRDNGQSTSHPSGSQQSSLDSLYTPARVTASHSQLVPTPFSPAEALQRPSILQHAARGNEESYGFSIMIPPNQAQLNVNRFSNHQADIDTPQLQQHATASSGNSRPLAPGWSQGSLYGSLPAPDSQPCSNTTPPGLIHSSSCLPRAPISPQADASQSQSRSLQGQIEDRILPGFVFTTLVGNTNASDASGTNVFGRYELFPHVPASQEHDQDNAGDDPPGLFHLSRSSDTSHHVLNRDRPQDDEDVAMDLEQNDEEQIPGLGSSWIQNEYLASRRDFEGDDGPDIDHVFTFDAHDAHSAMGGNSMDVDILATGHTEEDAFAVEQDLTDTLGMQFSASVGPLEADISSYDALPATQPASQSSSPPDPLSGPSIYWDSILGEQPVGSTISHPPFQQSSQPVLTSQNHVQDLSQQQRVHEYTNDTPRASPAPSAYLSSDQALARQQARDQWGDKYDRALTAAYHQRHSREDPYAVEYGQPDLSGPPVSQDSRAADFPDDDSHVATPRPSQSRLPVEPTGPSPQVSSGPNPHSPYIPDRSLSQSDVQHQQPLTALAEHLRRAGANANTQFRSHLPVLLGKGASLPFTGRTHPRRPSDTVVPDSQEQRDKRERAKRKRVVWPDPLQWVFPEVSLTLASL